jgi:hypothetical protein
MSAEPVQPARSAKVTPLHVLACSHCGCTLPDLAAKMQELEDEIAGQAKELRSSAALLGRQTRELNELRDEEAPPADVHEVLVAWCEAHGKKPRTDTHKSGVDIGRGGGRWPIAQKAVQRYGKDRCLTVVRIHGRLPYLNFGVPSDRPLSPNDKKRWEIKYALESEERMRALEDADRDLNMLEPLKPPARTSRPLHWVLYTIQTQHKVPIRKTGQRGRYLTECPICKAEDMLVQEFGSSATFVRLTCPKGCNEQAIEFAYEVQDRVFSVPGVNERRAA